MNRSFSLTHGIFNHFHTLRTKQRESALTDMCRVSNQINVKLIWTGELERFVAFVNNWSMKNAYKDRLYVYYILCR